MKITLSALLAISLPVVSAMGATAVTSSTAPIVNVLVGSDAPNTSVSVAQIDKSSTTARFGGSTFTLAEAATVSAVTFNIFAAGNVGGIQANISLVSFSSFTSSDITYSVIHEESVTMPAIEDLADGKYLTFSFATPTDLDAGSYGLVFKWITNTSTGIRYSAAVTNDPNSSAFRITEPKTGSPSYTILGSEYYYLIQGTPLSSNVPEPSTAALLIGGVSLGAVVLRRARR